MRALLVRHRPNLAVRALVAAVGVCAALAAAAPAGAQQATQPPAPQSAAAAPARRDTSSLPFRDDQWGMDFGLGDNRAYRIGAIRFTSATRAWILDGRVSGGIDRTEYRAGPSDTLPAYLTRDAIAQGGSVSLLVGRRAYRALGSRAMRTVSFGVGGGFGYGETLAEGRRVGRSTTSNATAEFAVGAHYRITPSLALGGTTRLAGTYTWSESRQETVVQRLQRVGVGLGASELVLSLFF